MELCQFEITSKNVAVDFQPPTTEEIGKILAYQGMLLNGLGIAFLTEAESLDGQKRLKRLAEGTRTLAAAKNTLVEASRILEKYEMPPKGLQDAREKLIELAYDRGYDIAFEADGRVQLERVSRGRRELLESI